MAYAHRDAKVVVNVHGRWEDPADDKRGIGWARDFFDAATPFASGSVCVNFLTADEGDRVVFVVVNLITDMSYAWLDPRIRYD